MHGRELVSIQLDQHQHQDLVRVHVLSRLDVDRLVDRGDIAEGEGGGLVQGRGGRRLQRTQAREVVHLRGKVAEGLVSSDPDLV